MEERRWEELPSDCLVNVFGRVGMESLIYDVPFVCKKWYKATCDPLCWQELVFFDISTHPTKSLPEYKNLVSVRSSVAEEHPEVYFSKMLKYAVDRSSSLATRVWLPSSCTKEALVYVAEKCPNLMNLGVPAGHPLEFTLEIENLMSKWKNLEFMLLDNCCNMKEILAQVSKHCDNFESLVVIGGSSEKISLLGFFFPNLKSFALFDADIFKKDVVTVLKDCSKLVNCVFIGYFYFKVDDEILMLARRISMFKCHSLASIPSPIPDFFPYFQYLEDDVDDGSFDYLWDDYLWEDPTDI